MYQNLFVFLLIGALAGCAATDDINARHAKGRTEFNQVAKSAENGLPPARTLITRSERPYVAGAAVGQENVPAIPAILMRRVEFSPSADMTLARIAERLTVETGVTVRLMPDVYLSGGASGSQPSGPPAQGPSVQPMQLAAKGVAPQTLGGNVVAGGNASQFGLSASSVTGGADPLKLTMRPNYSGPYYALLDQITVQLGLAWNYADGAVLISRHETRRFEYRGPAGVLDSTVQIGKGSNSGGGAGAGASVTAGASFSTTASLSATASLDPWAALKEKIKAIIGGSGTAAFDPATGSVLVTATRPQLNRVGEIIRAENAIFTRQVAVTIRFIQLSEDATADYGVDWSLQFQKIVNGVAYGQGTFVSPGSLVTTAAGGLGLAIVDSTSKWSGSQLAVQALAGMGETFSSKTNTVLATNRRPTPLAFTNQDTYLAETTPATGGGTAGGTGVPGLKAGVFTYGYMLMVTPTVFDDGTISVMVNGNVTVNRGIDTISTGEGATKQQIQTPKAESQDVNLSVLTKSGRALVVPVYSSTNTSSKKNTLDSNIPMFLGGSFSGADRKSTLYMIIEPSVVGTGA